MCVHVCSCLFITYSSRLEDRKCISVKCWSLYTRSSHSVLHKNLTRNPSKSSVTPWQIQNVRASSEFVSSKPWHGGMARIGAFFGKELLEEPPQVGVVRPIFEPQGLGAKQTKHEGGARERFTLNRRNRCSTTHATGPKPLKDHHWSIARHTGGHSPGLWRSSCTG